MVNQYVQIDTYDYGPSLTPVTFHHVVTDALITDGTAASCAEISVDSGTYRAVFTGALPANLIPAGTYRIRTAVSGAPIKRFVTLTGVDGEVAYARADRYAELGEATQAILNARASQTSVDAIQASLAANTVTVTGYASIDTDGILQLKRAHTATLTFTSDSLNLVSDLSVAGTKIILGIKDQAGRVWLSLEGTVLVATGLQSVRFVLTPALSLALIKGHHNFDVLAIYGYNAAIVPPYTALHVFTSGRVTVTDVYLDPLEL